MILSVLQPETGLKVMLSPGYTVILNCGTGDVESLLHCHITGSALEELEIKRGQKLWAVFKASSCFLVDAYEQTTPI
ncbi:MAG: hypothetical protein EGP13_03805 [SAR202 cluster bacterium]|nr:MAG: hypothetical protein EGP13_03805 [SAR202 cluster bacterium]